MPISPVSSPSTKVYKVKSMEEAQQLVEQIKGGKAPALGGDQSAVEGGTGKRSGMGLGDTAAPQQEANVKEGGGEQAAIEAIKNDSEIQNAFKNWQSLSEDEKLKIGGKISQIQGKAMGFEPVGDLSVDPSLAKPGQSGTYGRWTTSGGNAKITMSPAAMADPAKFLNTLTHEQGHEWASKNGGNPQNHGNGDKVYELGDAVERGVFGTDSHPGG